MHENFKMLLDVLAKRQFTKHSMPISVTTGMIFLGKLSRVSKYLLSSIETVWICQHVLVT